MRYKVINIIVLAFITVLFPLACGPARYTLNATVSPEGTGTIAPVGGTYDAGTVVTIIAEPVSGYVFDHWSDNATDTTRSVAITMDSDKSITAHFKKQEVTLTVSVNPIDGGTVSPSNSTQFTGSYVSVNAIPNKGYEFNYWSGDTVDKSSSISIYMDRNKSVTAHFKISLSQALSPVCKGIGIPRATTYDGDRHPLVLLDSDGNKHAWSDDLQVKWGWLAATIEETQLVVCIGKEQEQVVETCRYWTSGPPIIRYKYSLGVKLSEAKTGKVVAITTLYGSEPLPCENVEPYYLERKEGSHVSICQLEKWLWKYVEPPQSTYPAWQCNDWPLWY
jgi:uncharacterized repeat protein (TIGR02543 family)